MFGNSDKDRKFSSKAAVTMRPVKGSKRVLQQTIVSLPIVNSFNKFQHRT